MNTLSADTRQYLIVTANYWAFTLTDGALRMLVLLYFHQLGYPPLQIALLFVLYECAGVLTNLFGGWIGARVGLNRTMNLGLGLQTVALLMLLVPEGWLTVAWVMAAQALSGIAKDLNKMSAKSAIKLLLPADQSGALYRWVALLTGSKNALKGVGFFLGGALLSAFGFQGAVLNMAIMLSAVWLGSLYRLRADLGRAKRKPKFSEMFSRSRAVNILSAARLFLFASRDVWFVVALPVYLAQSLGWSHTAVGGFLALWIIAYGVVQALAPHITGAGAGQMPQGRSATGWVAGLALVPAVLALALGADLPAATVLVAGLLFFGAVFAVNSALHSYLIVRFAASDGVSVDVGFYYMANATGRLLGTVLSGWLFQSAGMGTAGLVVCLWASAIFLAITAFISLALPRDAQPMKKTV